MLNFILVLISIDRRQVQTSSLTARRSADMFPYTVSKDSLVIVKHDSDIKMVANDSNVDETEEFAYRLNGTNEALSSPRTFNQGHFKVMNSRLF